MKKIITLLLLAGVNAFALTPFYFSSYNSDGTPQTNQVLMRAYPPTLNGFTVYGTNIVWGGGYVTNTPNSSGFFSNAVAPNQYQFTIPALSANFYAVIPDATNYLSLAIYLTNAPVVGNSVGGFAIVTNLLNYLPATNGGAISISQLPFTPITNTYAAVTNVIGFVPATNGGTIANSQLATNQLAYYGNAAGSFTTNFGIVWLVYKTNGLMGSTWTNLPYGSFCSTTNGQFFVLSNALWLLK